MHEICCTAKGVMCHGGKTITCTAISEAAIVKSATTKDEFVTQGMHLKKT